MTHKRHKKMLSRVKGYRHNRKKIFSLAKQAFMKAGIHAYMDRRKKKRDFRGLWIVRINAAVREHGLSYSKFLHMLTLKGIEINRKLLSELAVKDKVGFDAIVASVK